MEGLVVLVDSSRLLEILLLSVWCLAVHVKLVKLWGVVAMMQGEVALSTVPAHCHICVTLEGGREGGREEGREGGREGELDFVATSAHHQTNLLTNTQYCIFPVHIHTAHSRNLTPLLPTTSCISISEC